MEQSTLPTYKDILTRQKENKTLKEEWIDNKFKLLKEEWIDNKLKTLELKFNPQFDIKYIHGKLLNVNFFDIDGISPFYLDLFIPMNEYGMEIEKKIEKWINYLWNKYCHFYNLSAEKEKLKMPFRKPTNDVTLEFIDESPKRLCIRFKDKESFKDFERENIIFLKLELLTFYKRSYNGTYSPVIVIDAVKTHKQEMYTFE